jgi:transglutaminase-like putative cysteine protease
MFSELELREGWVTVICLFLVLLCVAWAIQVAGWTDGLSILQGIVLLGGLMGIVLAKSRVPNRMAHLLSLLAGWTWTIYLTSQVLGRSAGLSPAVAVAELETRFLAFLFVPFTEGATADNHIFLLLLALLMWILAYFCAWAIFRWQRVWWAVIVCGVALLLNINYTTENMTVYLILFLLFSLLLVVRASLAVYEQQWRSEHVGYSSELISVFLRAGLLISVVVIFLAWVAPVALASRPFQPFWDKVGEPWRQFQDKSARIFRDLNYQNEPPLVVLGQRRMFFGGPVNLSDTPIADVDAPAGRYWRVLVFHEYTSDGWLSNDPDVILIGEDEQDLAFPELELRTEITQTITLHRDWGVGDALVAAAQPLRSGLPLRASVSFVTHDEDLLRHPDAPDIPPAPGDPSVLTSRQPLVQGESYQFLSSLTEADEESLMQAGTSYPDWVVPRYLQLPDALPNRVRSLAEQLTDGFESPYEKARAVERYLRRIPYDEQIEGPGVIQDGVDYFLFDARAGYCDYYASSMTVMLRAVGVPARYVRGYSQGTKEEGQYRLLESDGHAWPEVFFPGFGWVEFEPTGGEPALNRPRSQDPEEEAAESARDQAGSMWDRERFLEDEMNAGVMGPMPALEPLSFWQRVELWGWVFLGSVVLAAVLAVVLMANRRRKIAGLSVPERVYEDLVNWVRRLLRIEPLAHQTPNEYARAVARHAPKGREAVEKIAGLYVEERFSGRQVSGSSAEVAWRQAWPVLWRRWFERRVERLLRFWWKFVPPKDVSRL